MADVPNRSDNLTEPLTQREQEILACLAEGLTNQEIANQLYLAEKTVRWYNSQIYSKLGVSSREGAVEQGKALGLLALPSNAPVVHGKHNLPTSGTHFVGRRHELAELAALLHDDNTRLLTILAPGGMGKTRLAIEAARTQIGHYEDGVFFIPLAHLSSPDDIMTSVAEKIGFSFFGSESPRHQLLNYFRERHMLLVLDNFEHLVNDASLISYIIQAAQKLRYSQPLVKSSTLAAKMCFCCREWRIQPGKQPKTRSNMMP